MKKYKTSPAKLELIEISEMLKLKSDMGQLGEEYKEAQTMNQKLSVYYNLEGIVTGTFKMWKDKGYKIKKGSKSYKFWSKPIKAKKTESNDETQETKETKYKFFNVACVFTADQVEKK
tara:strand:+ start:2382 stop:2735 length:354 start_codon:yes stop_codon:yes gene_type:complete